MATQGESIGPGYFRFLRELKAHNNREWFNAHKSVYEQEVLRPTVALVAALEKPIKQICPLIQVSAKPMGGSLFRIYRDTRFSKDKSPYKTYMAARFHAARGGKMYPLGFYLWLGVTGVYLAGGSWQPEPPELHRIRDRIAAEPAKWKATVAVRSFRRSFPDGMGGEQLKRVPAPYDASHPCADDLRRKDFFAVVTLPASAAIGAGAPGRIAKVYRQMTPLVRFLGTALKLEW